MNYTVETVENIERFLEIVKSIKMKSEQSGNKEELLFRGQKVDKPLVPKLGRLKLNDSIKNTEKSILDEFKRGMIPLSEFKPEDEWDLLALAQHHGLPTRLLDWSYNSLVALWFTVSDAPTKNGSGEDENGVVWVLNADVGDFRADVEENDPLSNKKTKIYRPKAVSRRISAQAGAFTVHRINDTGKFYKFEKLKNYKPKLTKILIPPNRFKNIRKDLNMMGINHASIFPDLDGFCKHLERKFSKLDDE